MFSYIYNDSVRRNAEATKVMFLVMNLLGISPYNPNLKGLYKKLPVIYSIFLVGWFTGQILICIYFILNMDLSIPIIIFLVKKVCDLAPPILVITRSLYPGDYIKVKIDDIAFADQCLHSAGIAVNLIEIEQTATRLFKCFTVYTIFLLGLIVFNFVNILKTAFGYLYAFLLSIAFFSDILYSIYYTYYFCSVVIYFAVRFKYLNYAMSSMAEPRIIYGIRLVKVRSEKKNPLKITETVKFVHGVYRNLVKQLNDDCDLFITIQFLQSLLTTTLSIYVLTCVQIRYDSFTNSGVNIVFLFLSSIVHCFLINVCSTVFVCAFTSKQANCMEALIHRLVEEAKETDLIQMLDDFSVELLHEKVVFSGSGFFKIDYSLFTKIAGAVVSYVVIFLQFGKFDYTEVIYSLKNETIMPPD